MWRLPVFVIAILTPSAAMAAVGISHWERLVDEMLIRAEEPPARVPKIPEPASHPEPPRPPVPRAVVEFARYFQGSGSRGFAISTERLRRHQVMFQRIFAEEGVPAHAVWIGLVESGYRTDARSPKDALGIWQLMPQTAAAYGLTEPERSDAEKSTRAAARFLRFLYDRLQDWPLVLAAYNAGLARVESAIARGGTRDFWRLAELGLLPRETQGYVPAVLAARLVGEGSIDERVVGDEPSTSPRSGGGRVAYATVGLAP